MMTSDGSEVTSTSSTFNFTDADITIESSDGVQFLLHRRNLETHTKALTVFESDTTTKDEIAKFAVTESAEVLGILFQFIYPMRQPVLGSVEIDILVQLAEAVQKYQVFSAMNVCEYHLIKNVEKDPLSILVHTLRHYGGYETHVLVDTCARLLIRRQKTLPIVRRFDREGINRHIVHWIEYETMWEVLFKKVKSKIDNIPPHLDCQTNAHLCSNCRSCLISWVDDLRDISSITALRIALGSPKFLKQQIPHARDRCPYCRLDECKHIAPLASFCQRLVEAIPEFTEVLDQSIRPVTSIEPQEYHPDYDFLPSSLSL